MAKRSSGFSLIESLVATAILVPALVSIAFVFIFSTASNTSNRQRAAGVFLLADKMEQLRSLSLDDAAWSPEQYAEDVRIATDGTIATSALDSEAPFRRVWQISGASPRTVTVIVYSQHAWLSRSSIEVARATMVSP